MKRFSTKLSMHLRCVLPNSKRTNNIVWLERNGLVAWFKCIIFKHQDNRKPGSLMLLHFFWYFYLGFDVGLHLFKKFLLFFLSCFWIFHNFCCSVNWAHKAKKMKLYLHVDHHHMIVWWFFLFLFAQYLGFSYFFFR